MSWLITPQQKIDPDAAAYLSRVEAVDGQVLEAGVRTAVDNFVIGCKQDGIWGAIKASCILVGARTLNGALQPLAGTAPTNYNFVAGDYNRKTGLVGGGSTKYLDSNRNNNADPQNSNHNALYISTSATVSGFYMGSGTSTGDNSIYRDSTGITIRSRSANVIGFSGYQNATGLLGTVRTGSVDALLRANKQDLSFGEESQAPSSGSLTVFGLSGVSFTNARLAFYSIGESLDLAKLDGRVTALVNALAAAIP